MNESVYRIAEPDVPVEQSSMSVSGFSEWKTNEEAAEDARLETLERELSAPPPYLYRGRRERCFFPARKMRWRKG